MLHKRKRSDNILSSPTSDFSSTTNLGGHMQSFYPNTKPILSPFHSACKELDDTPFHLSSRTRKRHRDNRPDASTVHGASSCWLGAVIQMSALSDVCRVAASTIQRLYQAQQQQQQQQREAEPVNQQHSQEQQQTTTTQQPLSQKSTLHSFWRIEQPVPNITPQIPYTNTPQEARCEDCDGALKSEDAMDVDTVSIEDKACGSCRRPICDGCAVYGRERICGGCAGCERGW